MEFKSVDRTTLVDVIIEQLKGLILSGDLAPGDKLPSERKLTVRFSVSRTTVREVLKGLSGLGLLVQNKEGTFVNNEITKIFTDHLTQKLIFEHIEIEQLYETRKILEVHNVELACERASLEDLDNIYTKLRRNAESLESPSKFNYSDIAFHEAIALAAHNCVLFELFSAVRHLLWMANDSFENTDFKDSHTIKKASLQNHKEIFESIKDHDASKAKKEMLRHIEYVENEFTRI